MSRFEQIIEAAARQLDERGLLLNLQITQLTGGDEALVTTIRRSLTAAGVAEDRFGMGLARVGRPGACMAAFHDGRLLESETPANSNSDPAAEPEVADWWAMTNGSVRGPWSIRQLVSMREQNQLANSDLVRQGVRGAWLKPEEVEGLAAVPVPQSQPLPIPVEPAATSPDDTAECIPTVSMETPAEQPPQTNREHSPAGPDHSRPVQPASRDERPKAVDTDRRPTPAGLTTEHKTAEPVRVKSNPVSTASRQYAAPSDNPQSVSDDSVPDREFVSRLKSARTTRHRGKSIREILDVAVAPLATLLNSAGAQTSAGLRKLVLSGVLTPLIIVAAIWIGWSLWPPSSNTIYSEFAATHQYVDKLKTSKMSESQLASTLAPRRRRIQSMVKVLERRATDAPSIDRELLLAGKHGLLVILDYPHQSSTFEIMFETHMKQARLLLDGHTIEASLNPSPSPDFARQPAPQPTAAPQ